MRWLRKLLGTDFPDPQAGQVWRSRHSGRAFRVTDLRLSDCGKLWHVDVQHEQKDGKYIPIGETYYMRPSKWRSWLREDGRTLDIQWPRR